MLAQFVAAHLTQQLLGKFMQIITQISVYIYNSSLISMLEVHLIELEARDYSTGQTVLLIPLGVISAFTHLDITSNSRCALLSSG